MSLIINFPTNNNSQNSASFIPYRYETSSSLFFTDITGRYSSPFKKQTTDLFYKTGHNTAFVNFAQTLLGLQEVTSSEYAALSPEKRNQTQMRVIGTHGDVCEPWCAHTVSYVAEQCGINIGGHYKAVSEFIQWGKSVGRYKPISHKQITPENYLNERAARASEIKKQLRSMKEGDLIIWKNSLAAKLPDGEINTSKSSHIGIIESVKNGVVTVLEGNANEFASGQNYERRRVVSRFDGINGNQEIGEPAEVNRRDGFIRKKYTIEDLANFGYSGYIDMQGLIK